jgi:hypothetical protein
MSQGDPGRVCPLRYRYGPEAIAAVPPRDVQTLYVIGGLYGNLQALDRIEMMACSEAKPPTLCFNGDFNWFNVDDTQFAEVNHRVLAHDAILGNVEAEFGAEGGNAGCGCAYPESVDAGVVERSNRIHARLRATAARHPRTRARLEQLPMIARYQVADCRIGVVHGDAESLAGWRFDVTALDAPDAGWWLRSIFDIARVNVFASTHTCLPAMRGFARPDASMGWVINNGAAGMPNFRGDLCGLFTRIGTTPSPHESLHEIALAGAHIALLPLRYDARLWQWRFVDQWPPGSDAWVSYFDRITRGPQFVPGRAIPLSAGHHPARNPRRTA